MPGADPGHGYMATNNQLFGSTTAPPDGTRPSMQGFVKDFASALQFESGKTGWTIFPGTTENDIMGCFTPQMLPVLSALAKGYAVCDHWYSSVPTETMPNRAFALAATSQGHMDDNTRTFTSPSIFGLLGQHNVTWGIYGYDAEPLTMSDFTDIATAPGGTIGQFSDFAAAAAAGSLPSFCFLEPSWPSTGNSQHPPYNVAAGEQLMRDVYEAVRSGPGWPQTLLVITYDEHGGLYDHVPPPWGAVAPDKAIGEFGFDLTRFGVRVPTVLISPLIAPGTVYRVPDDSVPLDHTSVLKTVEKRWGLPALTARDAAAPDFGSVMTLTEPRTDDVLAGVVVPVAAEPNLAATEPSHLQLVQADLISRRYLAGGYEVRALAATGSNEAYATYIRHHSRGQNLTT
jgi:phospholipase C